MPDPAQLSVGDKIRIVAVPDRDLQDYRQGARHLKETIQVLKWMVGKEFHIWMIDEYGIPWVKVDYPDKNDAEHSMALMDTESWISVI